MIDHPILFSTPMVQALLDGRKSQTRRIVKDQPANCQRLAIDCASPSGYSYISDAYDDFYPKHNYGKPGDLLWVRETSAITYSSFKTKRTVWYRADNPEIPERVSFKWKPSIHMVKGAARIWLQTTQQISIERAHDISDEDVKAEGLKCLSKDGGTTWKWGIPDSDGYPGNDDYGWPWQEWEVSPKKAFEKLWRKINGDQSWDLNPYVWVIKFRILSLSGKPSKESLAEIVK
jgi:hypothetical protein